MLVFENQTDVKLDIGFLHDIYDSLSDEDMELIFVDDEQMRGINKAQRGKDSTTDVLSFPLEKMPFSPIGSIVISLDKAKALSEELGHSLEEEISLLFIHGYLHVIGYDHEKDQGQMRQKEEELIKKFALPKSLIVRVQG